MNKEKIMNKYKVTQEFMEELNKWRYERATQFDIVRLDQYALNGLPDIVKEWHDSAKNVAEENERLMAVFRWTAGEDVFEVGKTHKFGVRSVNHYYGGNLWLRVRFFENGVGLPSYNNLLLDATLFTKRDEAELWTTNGFEVVEVDE